MSIFSWICWFVTVRRMWWLLATSHAPITANENLANKQCFCLGLVANTEDLLRPVYARVIILGIFDPFCPSWYVIPLGELDGCWEKIDLFEFDVLQTPSEAGCLTASDTGDLSMAGLSFTCGMDCNVVSVLLLFSRATLSSWLGGLLVSSSRSVVNQVFLRSILYGAPILELCCTRYVQFGGIVNSLMNGTAEN